MAFLAHPVGCQAGALPFTRMQASCSSFASGSRLVFKPNALAASRSRVVVPKAAVAEAEVAEETVERLRLHNLSPQPGSRRPNKRKGRGYGAGQGGSCGFGMRGQKSRSGSGSRPGFQGGQTPLYRQMPKLKGIAGGMAAGVPSFVTINLGQLSERFTAGEEVSLQTLKDKRVLNVSGKEAKLPLKVLADGELTHPLKIAAAAVSGAARAKIEAAGGSVVDVPQRAVWTKALGKERTAAKAAAEAARPKAPKATKKKKDRGD